MPNNTSITSDQLGTLFWGAELGGDAKLANHFSYAEKGQSTYSFGVPQFDVDHDDSAPKFLKENGFSDKDIHHLSQHGRMSRAELDTLDAKLQAIPQAKIDQLTSQHLDSLIGGVDKVIEQVRKQNPAAADAISKDPKLQLSIADYENQFGSAGPQLVGFLAGKPEKLQGGTVQTGNPPTRDDLVNFVHNTKYGQDPDNAKAIESRNEQFDEAMGKIKLEPSTQTHGHASHKIDDVLKEHAHGPAVSKLQGELSQLGYTDAKGKPLKVDGDFGPGNHEAVEAFQHDHGLAVDGKVGPATEKALEIQIKAHAKVPGLDNPKNPDHALYGQALAGVRKLDAQAGRASDSHSANLAAALVVDAKREGLIRIDTVALSTDNGSRVFAVQNGFPLQKFAEVPTLPSLNTPIAQSSAAVTLVNHQQAAVALAKAPEVPLVQPSPEPARGHAL